MDASLRGCTTGRRAMLKDLNMSSKKPPNHGKSWTSSDVKQLKQLAGQNTPTRVIGLKMGRSPSAVYGAASTAGVSLKPTNQSPYTRRKP
jgi:hypothetical protein